jgi:hypothetical protein
LVWFTIKSIQPDAGDDYLGDGEEEVIVSARKFLIRKIPAAMKYAKDLNFVGLNSVEQKVIPRQQAP